MEVWWAASIAWRRWRLPDLVGTDNRSLAVAAQKQRFFRAARASKRRCTSSLLIACGTVWYPPWRFDQSQQCIQGLHLRVRSRR